MLVFSRDGSTLCICICSFLLTGVFFGNGDSHTALRKFTLGALRDFGVGKKGIEARIQEEVVV